MRYGREDFEKHLLDLSVPAQRFGKIVVGDLTLDPNAAPPFEKWDALMELDAKFRLSWHRRRKDMANASASEYDLSLASLGVLSGWSDQEIVNTLIACRRKHKDDLKLRADYYQRTVGKAREAYSHETAVNELEQLLAKKDEPDTGGDRRSHALNAVREALKVNVLQVIRYTAEGRESEYEVVCEEGSIRVGNVDGILVHGRFQRAIAEVCGKVIPYYKRDRWRIIAQSLVSLREDRDLGFSASAVGVMVGWLRAYLSDNRPSPRNATNVEQRIPIILDDLTFIFLDHFGEWLARARGEHLSTKELGTCLRRDLEVSPRVIFHSKNGKGTSREVWPVPDLDCSGPKASEKTHGSSDLENG